MERHLLPAFLLVLVLRATTVCGNEHTETVSCPENQKAYKGSCYEFVTLQRTFVHAQAGCERSGGHLAFIHDEETQQFLQKHLQPGTNWWLGLASASFSLSLPSSPGEMVFIMLARSSPKLFVVLPAPFSCFLMVFIEHLGLLSYYHPVLFHHVTQTHKM